MRLGWSDAGSVCRAAEAEEPPQETPQEEVGEEESPAESGEGKEEAPAEEKKEAPAEEEEEAPAAEEEEAPAEEEEEEEEEELVDPKVEIEESCKPKCVKQLLVLQVGHCLSREKVAGGG